MQVVDLKEFPKGLVTCRDRELARQAKLVASVSDVCGRVVSQCAWSAILSALFTLLVLAPVGLGSGAAFLGMTALLFGSMVAVARAYSL